MKQLAIIALEYLEPEYQQTRNCLTDHLTYYFANRSGIGSIAEAFNECAKEHAAKYKYLWFITNITFDPAIIPAMVAAMEKTGYAAIVPTYNSDHVSHRKKSYKAQDEIQEINFIEFTAPMIRSEVFLSNPLDEMLPYWYHDLDWSYRVRQAGHKLGVLNSVSVEHTYLRDNHNKHPITLARMRLRNQANPASLAHLERKYGVNWRKLIWS